MVPNGTNTKKDRWNRIPITVQEELMPVKLRLNAMGFPDKEMFNEKVRELGIQYGFITTGKTIEMDMHLHGAVERENDSAKVGAAGSTS